MFKGSGVGSNVLLLLGCIRPRKGMSNDFLPKHRPRNSDIHTWIHASIQFRYLYL